MIDFETAIRDFLSQFTSTSSASQSANTDFGASYYSASKNIGWTEVKAGRIYTFDYPIKSPEESTSSFVDRRPILMIIPTPANYPKGKIVGLDLVLLRPDLRGNLLRNLSSVVGLMFKDGTVANEQEVLDKLSRININFAKTLLSGFPVEKIVKGYDIRYIPGLIEIKIADWVKIPYLSDFKIDGTTPNRIYNS
jgi:hypothetical protein